MTTYAQGELIPLGDMIKRYVLLLCSERGRIGAIVMNEDRDNELELIRQTLNCNQMLILDSGEIQTDTVEHE